MNSCFCMRVYKKTSWSYSDYMQKSLCCGAYVCLVTGIMYNLMDGRQTGRMNLVLR